MAYNTCGDPLDMVIKPPTRTLYVWESGTYDTQLYDEVKVECGVTLYSVNVEVRNFDDNSLTANAMVSLTQDGSLIRRANTDSNGTVSFSVPAGTYTIQSPSCPDMNVTVSATGIADNDSGYVVASGDVVSLWQYAVKVPLVLKSEGVTDMSGWYLKGIVLDEDYLSLEANTSGNTYFYMGNGYASDISGIVARRDEPSATGTPSVKEIKLGSDGTVYADGVKAATPIEVTIEIIPV